MKALVFDTTLGSWDSTRGFELQDVPAPVLDEQKDPADAERVLIRVHYAGVCGSDRGIWNRTAFKDQILGSLATEKKERRIIGHEFFGEIVKIGSKVSQTNSPLTKGETRIHGASQDLERPSSDAKGVQLRYGETHSYVRGVVPPLSVGDFVSCESHVVCNKCFQCLAGEKHVCTNEKILGISHDGGFAEFVKVPSHIVWKTDTKKIRPEIAACQEPFGNAVHAATKVPLKDKTIAIFGLGPIGLFLSLVARGLGAKTIIGIEPNPVSQDMARRLGIDYVIPLSPLVKGVSPSSAGRVVSPSSSAGGLLQPPPRGLGTPFTKGDHHRNEDVVAHIEELTKGLGVDVAFEMSGFNSSFNNCLFSTRRGGHVIAFGIKSGDFVLEDYNRFIVRGITIHAIIGRRLFETWETTKKLLEDTSNGIQEKIWNVILNQGKDTVLPLREYTKEVFEKKMSEHPKILLEI
ncbi:MAG: alcohol dehydrogenase catalytic domain-containing protein [bacterium]|nr:alcohol dehydrogenase catalytic domain-containing protein [bacterium]